MSQQSKGNLKKSANTSQIIPHVDNGSKATFNNVSDNADINVNDIIFEEYKHSKERKSQIMQERTNTINIYIILLGIAVSGFGLSYSLNINLKFYSAFFLGLILIALGIAHIFFFVRFIIWAIYKYEDAIIMSKIRDFYSRKLQPKNPEVSNMLHIRNTFYSSQSSLSFDGIVLCAFAFNGSVCLGAFIFIMIELVFHINNGEIFPLPSDIRPYLFGVIVVLISLLSYGIAFKKFLIDQRHIIMTQM